MDKKNSAVKAGIGYLIGNYLLKGLTFFTIPIFSRLLAPHDYGIYNSFVAYESILSIVTGIALHSSYKNAKFRYKNRYDSYVSSSILLIIVTTIIFAIVINILFFININIFDFNLVLVNLLIIYSFSNAIIMCFNAYVGLEFKYKSFLYVAGFNAVSNIILSLILIHFLFVDARYMGRIVGTVIPAFLVANFIIINFFKQSKPKINFSYWKWGVTYSLPIVPHGISQVILSQFDRIMIQKLVNYSTAGIYSFAYNVFTIISVTSTSVGTAWEPWFYRMMNNSKYYEIRVQSSRYILGMLFFISVMLLVSPEIIYFLGTKKYVEAKYSVLPIIAGGYFSFLYTLPAGIEYYFSKTKYIAMGTIFAALLNIILNFIFITKFGYIAASYTTLFTYLIYFICHYILSYKILGFQIFSTKTFCLAGIADLFVMTLAIILIENVFLRWAIAIILVILFFTIEEMKLGYFRKRFSKWKNLN